MRLAEVDGKAVLRRNGLAVPRGVLLGHGGNPPDEVAGWPGFFLKAQVLQGGRGRDGLVRGFASADECREARRLILVTLDDADTPLLLEEAVPIAREIFMALRVDGTQQCLELLVAPEGGINVEHSPRLLRIPLAEKITADAIFPPWRGFFPPISRRGLPATPAACARSSATRIWSSLKSIRWRSRKTARLSPATPSSCATMRRISGTTRTTSPSAACLPNAP